MSTPSQSSPESSPIPESDNDSGGSSQSPCYSLRDCPQSLDYFRSLRDCTKSLQFQSPNYSPPSPSYPCPKRLRSCRTKTTVVDRISLLPDSLIVHILSYLPIEEAIKTQLLSKRWQFLWTSLPSLLFRFNYYDYRSSHHPKTITRDFVTFVDKTLVLSNCSKLHKFGVDMDYDPRFASNVNLWTRFATRNASEVLRLELSDAREEFSEEDRFELPQLLFTNSSFRELGFSLCSVVPKGVVGWKSLRKLSIGRVKLSEDVIGKILEGSPALEILELYYFYGLTRLHVSSNSSLKKMILREFWDFDGEDEEPELEISAPNLQSLEILGCLERKNFSLADVSSLVDATLNFNLTVDHDDRDDDYKWVQNILRALLQSLVHVKNLTLGNWALQVLSIMETNCLHSPFSKCKKLTLNTRIKESVLPGIAHLLGSSRHLETLVITMSNSIYAEYFWDYHTQLFDFDEDYWTSQNKAFHCLMVNLKTVKFAGLRWYHCDFHFSFVQFLLKNARMLQKMVINTLGEDCIPADELFQAAQKLLSFPRASTNAVVMFN